MTEPLKIIMTAEAIAAALDLQKTNPEHSGKALRIYLAGKGCDGFEYGVGFDLADGDDIHIDTGQSREVDVVVDKKTLGFVAGSTILWVDDERGRGFLVENPSHRKFRGKFYKSKFWEQRLATTAPQ